MLVGLRLAAASLLCIAAPQIGQVGLGGRPIAVAYVRAADVRPDAGTGIRCGARQRTASSHGDVIATPLAWSPDSRYLAISFQETSIGSRGRSGLAVIDTAGNTLTKIAYGQIFGASFAQDGGDEIVYGRAPSLAPGARVNLCVSGPAGAGVHALTSDGRSLNPLWGPRYIAYDREQPRPQAAPAHQIWLASPSRPPADRARPLCDGRGHLARRHDRAR
jgi:hypothetical protein